MTVRSSLSGLTAALLAGACLQHPPNERARGAQAVTPPQGLHGSGSIELRWQLVGRAVGAGRAALHALIRRYNSTPDELTPQHPDHLAPLDADDPLAEREVQVELVQQKEVRVGASGTPQGENKRVVFFVLARFPNRPDWLGVLLFTRAIRTNPLSGGFAIDASSFQRTIQLGGAGGNDARRIHYEVAAPTGSCSFQLQFTTKDAELTQFPSPDVYLSEEIGDLIRGPQAVQLRVIANNRTRVTFQRREHNERVGLANISDLIVQCRFTDEDVDRLLKNVEWNAVEERAISGRSNTCFRGTAPPGGVVCAE